MYSIDDVAKTDKDIADLIEAELARQNSHIELIASENWVSKAVMAAMGSPLTNKYAEGYPAKRYYGGCENVDILENLVKCIHRCMNQIRAAFDIACTASGLFDGIIHKSVNFIDE